MNKPRLLIFIHSLGPGGAERITALLAKELQHSFDIHIALLDPTICYAIPENIPIYILAPQKEGTFYKLWTMGTALKNFITLVRTIDNSIVLATLNRPIFIAILAKLLGRKFRLIISEHTMQSLWRGKEKLFSTIKRLAITTLYAKADAIIAVSKGIRHDLIKNFALNEANISTVYNPFDLDFIATQSLEPVNLPTLPLNAKRIVTAGTLKPLKHHSLLIDALASIPGETTMVLLGDGELRTALQTQIDHCNLTGRVLMPGFVSNPYPYFRHSDIFVLTSDFEGLPTVIIEALACGCAVISTDCPSGPREILAPNSNIDKQLSNEIELAEYGILIPVGNAEKLAEAILLLLTNFDLFTHYREKAFIRAQDFDKSIQLPKYVHILKGIK